MCVCLNNVVMGLSWARVMADPRCGKLLYNFEKMDFRTFCVNPFGFVPLACGVGFCIKLHPFQPVSSN